MSAFLAGCVFGFCAAGWFFGLMARRPRVLLGPGLDVDRAVRRPEVRAELQRALKGERT